MAALSNHGELLATKVLIVGQLGKLSLVSSGPAKDKDGSAAVSVLLSVAASSASWVKILQ